MKKCFRQELKSLFREIKWFKEHGFAPGHEIDGAKLIREKRDRIKEIYSYQEN